MNDTPSCTHSAEPSPEDLILHYEEAVNRMGDKEIYLEIAHYFASHLDDSLNDLAAALAETDLSNATRLAHSLKSNCATIGAEILRERCANLERLCREGDSESARALHTQLAPRFLALRGVLLDLKGTISPAVKD